MQSHLFDCCNNSGYVNDRVDNRYDSIIQRNFENASEGYIVLGVAMSQNMKNAGCVISQRRERRMKKLNKRYEKSLKSVRAQVTCPCSGVCSGCNGEPNAMQSQVNRQTENSKTYQTKLWS